jgi:hypothetical protein
MNWIFSIIKAEIDARTPRHTAPETLDFHPASRNAATRY